MVPENAALRLAKGRQWIAHDGGARCGMPVPQWEDLTPAEQEQAETEARHWLRAAYNIGLWQPSATPPRG